MTSLRQTWLNQLHVTPRARTLDVAKSLGVTEAELLYSRVGDDAVLLRPDWAELTSRLPSLGRVMCLTRNAHVVHECEGAYDRVEVSGPIAGVYGEDIDQRLFIGRWGFGIAAPVETRRGSVDSLQFFDRRGIAVLKIYARAQTDQQAWKALVARFEVVDPPESIRVQPGSDPCDVPDDDVDVEALRAAWAGMTDTHQVHGLLRRHQVGRLQALRMLGPEWAVPVDGRSLAALLERASVGEPIMVFVGNAGAIQIFSGRIGRVVGTDGWLNVLDPAFNLHVSESGLAAQWIVRKPTTRGPVWSFEAYGADDAVLLQVFGKRTESDAQAPSWHALLQHIQRSHALT